MKTERFYAKKLFRNSINEYIQADPAQKREMIQDLKTKLEKRERYFTDRYTIGARWFIRLENYINNKIITDYESN